MRTFKVTFPATITLEMEGISAVSVECVIREAFGHSAPYDPLSNRTFAIGRGEKVQCVGTIRTTIIDEDDSIDVTLI